MFTRNLADAARAALLFGLIGGAALPAQSSALTSIDPRRDCGTYCTTVVLDRLGKPAPPFEVLRDQLRTDARGLTNLADIAATLESHGVRVRVQGGDRKPGSICIAPLKVFGGERGDVFHFVTLEPVGEDFVVYYPPVWSARQPWSALRDQLGDRLLVIEEPGEFGLLRAGALLLAAFGALTFFASGFATGKPR